MLEIPRVLHCFENKTENRCKGANPDKSIASTLIKSILWSQDILKVLEVYTNDVDKPSI